MPFGKQLKVHRSYLHLVPEEDLLRVDCLSITDGDNNTEQKIYLAKFNDEFEVRVYKASPNDTYVPSHLDFSVRRYQDCGEYVSFFFGKYFFANRFIRNLREVHPEFSTRPL